MQTTNATPHIKKAVMPVYKIKGNDKKERCHTEALEVCAAGLTRAYFTRAMLLAFTLMLSALSLQAQTVTQNYVRTRTPRTKISSNATLDTYTSNKDSVETTIQYIDGIGRPLQSIQVKGSPLGFDMIQPYAYDAYGRQSTNYLPYTPQTGTAGTYRSTALPTDQTAFYTTPPSGSGVTAITDPYAQIAFEISPLNRPVEQGAPGVAWQLTGVSGGGHTVKMVYTLNNDTLFTADSVKGRQVARYNATVNSDQTRTIAANGYYPANTLTVTISKDENWVSGRAGTVEEYKDKEGHVILKRQYNYTTVVQCLSTYYVYDDMGQLAFVLPPAAGGDAATTPTAATLNNLCYQYRYDERARASQKKIPGKGWEYTVYNTLDQPVATQDSLQRANKNWIVTKYDAMGRPALTHIWNNGGTAVTRAALQTTLTGINANLWEAPTNTGTGYTNVAWPTTSVTATLTTDYYDGYLNIPGLPATYTVSSGISNMTRGLTTVKKTAVLNTPADQLWDVIYNDDLGRNIQSYMQHYLGGTANTNNYDLLTTTYNFTNAPTTTLRQHFTTTSATIPQLTVANTYYYDHMGRKRSAWEQITKKDSTATPKTLISKIEYNEIGQVLNKHLHSTDSTTYLQNIAYTYNERGWLLGSSAPLFALNLYYNTLVSKAYNGNIMYQYWGTPGSLTNSFAYTYDKLNRLTAGSSTANNKEFPSYDLMGNITTMGRYQTGTAIDALTYTYTDVSGNYTNQVQKIVDADTNAGLVAGTTNYSYDGNGNLSTNTNTVNTAQNKSFGYNLLNLPQTVTVPTGTVTYTYDATGNKLRKVSVLGGVTTTHDYISGIQYENSTTAIAFIQTEEGKAALAGAGANYTYYLGDNLGNTRITFETRTSSAVTIQSDDYYPFGMEINNTPHIPKNEYLYNKKELQEETQEYDYGARYYDPVIARWNAIDPLAEVSRRWTPYNYVQDDPIRYTDPDGMQCDGCKTAKTIIGAGLIAAGSELAVAAPTVVGEVVAVPAAVVTVAVATVASGTYLLVHTLFSSDDTPEPATLKTAPKGSNNPTTKKAAETGQEAHRQIEKGLEKQGAQTEVQIPLKDGTNVRKDAVMPDGTPVIIKPDTKSGNKSAKKREDLLKKNGYDGDSKPLPQVKLYDPLDPAYQPDSPTYMGPKSKKTN